MQWKHTHTWTWTHAHDFTHTHTLTHTHTHTLTHTHTHTHSHTHTHTLTPGGTAGKEDHLVLFLVVEEVVKGPQTPVLTVGVRVQIRIVAESTHNILYMCRIHTSNMVTKQIVLSVLITYVHVHVHVYMYTCLLELALHVNVISSMFARVLIMTTHTQNQPSPDY